MAGDDGKSANIESLNAALADAEIKAATGEEMYLVRAKYLRDKLAAITIPTQQTEPSFLPQSVRMTALNTAHTEAKAKEKSTEKNLEGSTQVTVVPYVPQGTPDAPCATQGDLAGASLHAPDIPQREKRKHQSTAKKNFTIRVSDDVRAALEAKAVAAKSYPSAYVLQLIAADLGPAH